MTATIEKNAIDKATLDVLDTFLASVRKSAVTALSRSTLHTADERALGIRHILDSITLALAVTVHDGDALHPELTIVEHPHRKFGGDNIDAVFFTTKLCGSERYRLYGKRGTVSNISFVVQDKGPGFTGSIVGALTGDNLQVDENGEFELFFGGDSAEDNWIPLPADTDRLIIRQYFADWAGEEPMTLQIERLGERVSAPKVKAEELLNNILAAGQLMESEAIFWADMIDKFRPAPNQFIDFFAKAGGKINAAPGGRAFLGYWNIPKDSVLIMRVVPPECSYWNIELYSGWWESSDYRYRLSGTNMHYSEFEDNGELIVVIAHDDPSVPNWFDTSGITEGLMTVRWMQSEEAPIPQCTLVKRAELKKHLPLTAKTISPQQRQQQIDARHQGVYNRFHYM